MKLNDVSKWNVRLSMAYAIGVWTMLGSYGYYRFFLSNDERGKPHNTEDKEELTDKLSAEPEKEKPKGFHVQTTIVYKENFVPYSTRIFNYLKTLNGSVERTEGSQRSEK